MSGFYFFFSSRRRHTRSLCDWSSDVCSSDLGKKNRHIRGQPAPTDIDVVPHLMRKDESSKANAKASSVQRPINTHKSKEAEEIGRASCRERVKITVDAGASKKKER